MYKIPVTDPDRVTQAIEWCMTHLDKSQWDVHAHWPATAFVFKFDRMEDASAFGLTWIY